MKTWTCFLASLLTLFLVDPCTAQEEYSILTNGVLARADRLSLGIDDGLGTRGWLSQHAGYLRIKYPGDLPWAALFITVGGPAKPTSVARPGKDCSAYKKLVIEMKGEAGGECVAIGIKDNDDPDDGTEVKVPIRLKQEWTEHTINLSTFVDPSSSDPLDLSRIYVIAEIVLPCEQGTGSKKEEVDMNGSRTIYLKSIKLVK